MQVVRKPPRVSGSLIVKELEIPKETKENENQEVRESEEP